MDGETCTITVYGSRERLLADVAELRTALDPALRGENVEMWLSRSDGPMLGLLANGGRGWLMYLRHQEGDSGFSTRDPDYNGPAAATREFRLSNGQVDEYPEEWTLPVERLLPALEAFVRDGTRAPDLCWHED